VIKSGKVSTRYAKAVSLIVALHVASLLKAQEFACEIDPKFVLDCFSLTHENEAILIPVRVNNSMHPFLLDTGSSISIYDNSLIPLSKAPIRSIDVVTPSGPERVPLCMPPDTRIGTFAKNPFTVVARADLSKVEHQLGFKVRGVLGMDFARGRIIHYDPDKKIICFLTSTPLTSSSSMPLYFPKGQSAIPRMKLKLPNSEVPQMFVIDTGLTSIDDGTLDEAAFSACSMSGHLGGTIQTSYVTMSGTSETSAGRLREFHLGPFAHKGLTFGKSNANSLGMSYRSRFVCTFDFKNETVQLSKSSAYSTPSYMPSSGMSLGRSNEKIVITGIRKGSASEKAGFELADEVVQIEGQQALEHSLRSIRIMLAGDRHAQVIVRRNGVERCLLLKSVRK
jgi:hypothetical protein